MALIARDAFAPRCAAPRPPAPLPRACPAPSPGWRALRPGGRGWSPVRPDRGPMVAMRAEATDGANGSAPADQPPIAETARTIVDIASHGTLCTLSEDGTPLGTHVTYVLDTQGQPILRLRREAVHTANVGRCGRCSLFVHPEDYPARCLARVTLLGDAEAVEEGEAESFRMMHQAAHGQATGVDRPSEDDLLYRLRVSDCFFVGGLGGAESAESVSSEDYKAAEPDFLRHYVPDIILQWNRDRAEDIVRLCRNQTGLSFMELSSAELVWVDRLGMYVNYTTEAGRHHTLRSNFPRQVQDDRDARSLLTMAAQLAWEQERNYVPAKPRMDE